MLRSRNLRLTSLTLANILLPISVLIFASGFFPYKPLLPGLATFEDLPEPGEKALVQQPEPVFDRVVFMVVDALRSDFVFGHGSGFGFVQSLIREGAAVPFTAHAPPPTVTMPRVKALTTGSVPSFLDLILNFAESDTSSSLSTQDTWLAQLRAHRNGSLVFYGDDTWLKLFPDTAAEDPFWLRHDGTSSFFVSDFTEVDNNVTRHVPEELATDDWSAMVLHYLGLDHIGHKTGPQGPNMLPKQREMDGIVKLIYEAMEREEHHGKTLLVLIGDHGMNAGGNHGGSGPGETEPALVFASPRFKRMEKRREYECPTLPEEGAEFHYYTKIGQSDLVPTLAAMMGMPISRNNLGVLIRELAGLWKGGDRLQLLHQNAQQMLQIVRAKYGAEWFDGQVASYLGDLQAGRGGGAESPFDCAVVQDDAECLASRWAFVTNRPIPTDGSAGFDAGFDIEWYEQNYYSFLWAAQKAMSDTASSYDIPRMVLGMLLTGIAFILSIVSLPTLWPLSTAGLFFTTTCALHGVMMFASSYVEEEQHFWYWLTPAWIALLAFTKLREANDSRRKLAIAFATFALLTTHRLCVRWNQTGQKHTGDNDVVHTFFPSHHIAMWLLILITYILNGVFLHQRSFKGLFMPELAAFFTSSLVFLGVVFKLNFTQADAPELVLGLAEKLRVWSEPLSLVLQARAVFGFLGVAAAIVAALSFTTKRSQVNTRGTRDDAADVDISLAARLHSLLTLFLMTETRAPNIPLFALLEIQRAALGVLLSSPSPSPSTSPSKTLQTATSTLLLSHTYYFCTGGSNSISSLDLSNAYNGIADYNIAAVGLLLFASNWTGPLWWCSAGVLLLGTRSEGVVTADGREGGRRAGGERGWIESERAKLRLDASSSSQQPSDPAYTTPPTPENLRSEDAWPTYLSSITTFIAASLVAVMAACTALRTHLFIWTVFSPKFLYAMAWGVGWHLGVNVGLGGVLWRVSG